MNLGDLVRIKPQYSRDQYGDPKEWKLFDEPYDPIKIIKKTHTCTFKEYQVGTVLGFTVRYDSRRDVKVLVGDRVGWIDESILCKVYE